MADVVFDGNLHRCEEGVLVGLSEPHTISDAGKINGFNPFSRVFQSVCFPILSSFMRLTTHAPAVARTKVHCVLEGIESSMAYNS